MEVYHNCYNVYADPVSESFQCVRCVTASQAACHVGLTKEGVGNYLNMTEPRFKSIAGFVVFVAVFLMLSGCSDDAGCADNALKYGVNGFSLPSVEGGFDYRLGKYRIGEKEKDGPCFTEAIKESELFDCAYVSLPDGFIDRIIVHGDSESKSFAKDEMLAIMEKEKNSYADRFGFSFRKECERNGFPYWKAEIDPKLNTSFNIYAIKWSGDNDRFLLCEAINAMECISNSVAIAERNGYMKRNSLLDLRLGEEVIGRACEMDGEFKLKHPFRHFTRGRYYSTYGRVYQIELLGFLDDLARESGENPAENYENVRVECETLVKMYSEKYGFNFDEKLPPPRNMLLAGARASIEVNKKMFPGARFYILFRDSLRAGIDEWDIKLVLDAEDLISAEGEKEMAARARSKALSPKEGMDCL